MISSYRADVDQFAIDYRAYRADPLGYSQFSGSGYYSPGGLIGNNRKSDFATFTPGLKNDYYYGRILGERSFTLPPWGFQLKGRAALQETSTGLLPSEQLYEGGYSILRGYPESIVSGDTGWYASAELHAPLIQLGNITGVHNVPNFNGDTLDLFGFFDTGAVQPVSPNAFTPGSSGVSPTSVALDSAGGGLVWHIGQNFTANVAYGYELKNLPSGTPSSLTKDKGRFHIYATLAF
jgi:hemolysin activation/secretion protein